MKVLIITANPDVESLTSDVGRILATVVGEDRAEVADLAAEGFNPAYTLEDRRAYHSGKDYPADVIAEQQRLERATDLVLVFPVYWWSMPALLKGWIDRVFTNGWAYGARDLGWLRIHMIPIAASDEALYDRHGYHEAIETQIRHGILDYCRSTRGVVEYLYESEHEDPEARRQAVERVIGRVSNAISN